MSATEKIKVGDTLWFVPDNYYSRDHARDETVVKVGRLWAYTGDRQRLDLQTLVADHAYTRGQYYRDRDAYEASQRLAAAWLNLRRQIDRQYSAPRNVTLSAIHQAAALLGFTLTPEPPK